MLTKTLTSMFLMACILMLLTGCNTVGIDTKQELGVGVYPPTNPASVVIMRVEPDKPNIRLGEVYAMPNGSPTVTEIETKMKQAAAKMGADAVVIVSDQNRYMGTYVSGPWYSRQATVDYQRYIVGVAIKYTK